MQFKHKFTYSILLAVLSSCITLGTTYAEPTFSTDIVKSQKALSANDEFKNLFEEAVSKYEKLNIRIAYDDFYRLIEKYAENDFYLLLIAQKTAELGFCDLSDIAFSNVKDTDISKTIIQDTKRFFYPKCIITRNDSLILAELYSNISYNDRVNESINELLQYQRLLKDSDYANYIMALAYFKQDNTETAKKYIDTALKLNPDNIGYKILQAKIITGEKRGKFSKKIIKEIKNQQITTSILTDRINDAEEYIKYLTAQKHFDKNFHLGMYYFSKKDYIKATKIFQSAVKNTNQKENAKLYSMLARCYNELGDFSKADEYVQKALKITKNNSDCMLAMGDLKVKEGDLKTALKYYKSASSNKNIRQISLEKCAYTQTKLFGTKRGNELYKDIIKEYPNSYISYYKLGQEYPSEETQYIKKSLSLNIMFFDGWIDLARIMIESNHLKLADKYLIAANYIDNDNYKYYYYKNLLQKNKLELKRINDKQITDKVAHETQYFNRRRP